MSQYEAEVAAAVVAVRTASRVCRAVQERLITAETLEKKDKSPVTVADFASQAVVCRHLVSRFPNDVCVGEEDATELRAGKQAPLLDAIVREVGSVLDADPSREEVLHWIDLGNADASTKRYWTLDPIDGTKGFLRGEQYAVAFALLDEGQVVAGVLGCPNLPHAGGKGALFVAERGQGTRAFPLDDERDKGTLVHVSKVARASEATLCESVESGHSDQDESARIAKALGITGDPYRIDSQCKYAAVARADASIYLRLPTRKDYEEKIWDHAAGSIVVEEAGGRVSDIHGKPLDYTQGPTLKANSGVVATCGTIHDEVIEGIRSVREGA